MTVLLLLLVLALAAYAVLLKRTPGPTGPQGPMGARGDVGPRGVPGCEHTVGYAKSVTAEGAITTRTTFDPLG